MLITYRFWKIVSVKRRNLYNQTWKQQMKYGKPEINQMCSLEKSISRCRNDRILWCVVLGGAMS